MKVILTGIRFRSACSKAFDQSHSHATAIHAGLTKIAEKPPFNILTPEDIKRVVPVWSLIPDPKVIAKLVANCVREKNVDGLKSRQFLAELEKMYRKINRENGVVARR